MSEFTANCKTSSVGSLPHRDISEAIDLILKYCENVPAWPQLPNLGYRQNMYVQYAYDFPGVELDEEKQKIRVNVDSIDASNLEEYLKRTSEDMLVELGYDEDYVPGFSSFLERAKESAAIQLIKGQVTGPISLGLQLRDQKDVSIIYDDMLREILTYHLRVKTLWQQRALSGVHSNTLVVLDEPYMNMFGSAFLNLTGEEVAQSINEVKEGIPGLIGVHCCGNTDWGLMVDLDFDLISLDAYHAGDVLPLYSEKVQRFLRNGGIIAWGIVPSVPSLFEEETKESLLKRLEKLMGLLTKKGIEEDVLLRQSLVTPSCGLGGMDIGMAEDALEVTKWISDSLRAKHGLED